MGRQKLRRVADGLPFVVLSSGLVEYFVPGRLRGHRDAGLVAVAFVLALIVAWVMRRLSGMTWREALWPRREPPPWTKLPPSMTSVDELARAGKRLQAIKMYRELTGADLKASKEAVETMIAPAAFHEPVLQVEPAPLIALGHTVGHPTVRPADASIRK
ncbi:hypothetical protein GCM10023322_68440 [Rugosimonospora acidiphila]|uniref:Ribosomal protein L7/L12 C-terminal domain-containing protein n=1 Tax=Rugosimonospora acidiphila TaxID=556531 RepID=A0ABP9SLT0_9ACTN